MRFLVDTNLLLRLAQTSHPQQRLAFDALDTLKRRGRAPVIVPQVLYEFWVVATRPLAANGLDLSATQAAVELVRLKGFFPVLDDTAAILPEWERIVTTHSVVGKNAHDARLVAAMTVHGVGELLTFNVADFARFPGIVVIDPATVTPPATP